MEKIVKLNSLFFMKKRENLINLELIVEAFEFLIHHEILLNFLAYF